MLKPDNSPSLRGFAAKTRGFTLTEVIIAASVSMIVLAAVFTAFIFIARSSYRITQYNDMEGQARRAIHRFTQDARQAEQASWADANTLTLTVNGTSITYAYNSVTKTFSRTVASAPSITLATGITTFVFKAYQATGTEVALSVAGTAVKMIQINIELARTHNSTGTATDQIVSARCMLRNKKIN